MAGPDLTSDNIKQFPNLTKGVLIGPEQNAAPERVLVPSLLSIIQIVDESHFLFKDNCDQKIFKNDANKSVATKLSWILDPGVLTKSVSDPSTKPDSDPTKISGPATQLLLIYHGTYVK